MYTRKVIINEKQASFCLNFQGENKTTKIIFPEDPNAGKWSLLHQRAKDTEPYPVALTVENGLLVWTVTLADVAQSGRGQAQLVCVGEDGSIVKSKVYGTLTLFSLTDGGEVPEPVEPWYQTLMQELAAVPGQVQAAAENVLEQAKESGEFDGKDGEPGEKGDKGDPGAKGEPGEKGDPGGIDVSGAEVGQIVQISAVDEDGKPTAWEPVDMPSGGESVNADWNENDPDSPAYVQNRTHYKQMVEIVPEQEVTPSAQSGFYYAGVETDPAPAIGDTITLHIDGETYKTTVAYGGNDMGYIPVFGNLGLMGLGADTGEPYLGTVSGTSVYVYQRSEFSKMGIEKEVAIKLPSEFIPWEEQPNALTEQLGTLKTDEDIAKATELYRQGKHLYRYNDSGGREDYLAFSGDTIENQRRLFWCEDDLGNGRLESQFFKEGTLYSFTVPTTDEAFDSKVKMVVQPYEVYAEELVKYSDAQVAAVTERFNAGQPIEIKYAARATPDRCISWQGTTLDTLTFVRVWGSFISTCFVRGGVIQSFTIPGTSADFTKAITNRWNDVYPVVALQVTESGVLYKSGNNWVEEIDTDALEQALYRGTVSILADAGGNESKVISFQVTDGCYYLRYYDWVAGEYRELDIQE